MKPFTKISLWWHRRRKKHLDEGIASIPLREFVYLDEVSVYSLASSQLGPLAAEYTSTETTSLSSQVNSSLSANVHAVNAQIGSQIQSTLGTESQVVRKSIIQTTFRELRSHELPNLAISIFGSDTELPKARTLEELHNVLRQAGGNSLVISSSEIRRGKLLEIEVELEADSFFRWSTIITSVLEIVGANPKLAELFDRESIERAEAISHLLERLLVGLVPLKGRSVDYVVLEALGEEWIVHRQLLVDLPNDSLATKDLFVVGVAETKLFWKDLRRVLFSHSHYTVMCRANSSSLSTSWTPVKLVDVLHEVMPDLAGHVADLNVRLATPKQSAGALSALETTDPKALAFRSALIDYASQLASHYGKSCGETDLASSSLLTAEICSSYTGLTERRNAFDSITQYVMEGVDNPAEPDFLVRLRTNSLSKAGFTEGGASLISVPSSVSAPMGQESESRFLDSEIIAIYW